MPQIHFDFIIIGNGLAGLQLALAFSEDSYFSSKKIAVIDPVLKITNDKTWSFWETTSNTLSSLAHKSWKNATIITKDVSLKLDLKPYTYKSVKSIDFYDYCFKKLRKHENFTFITESVKRIEKGTSTKVITNKTTYSSSHVFNSIIPKEFYRDYKKYTSIIQHFKGWVIKTPTDSFDDTSFTKMDYRLKDGNQTTFMYVLPFSKTEALVEFTYFTENLVEESVYDGYIKKYINIYLNISDFEIIETEIGQIPMTTFPFYKFNTKQVTNIGTAGGWVKPSSGYSFKNSQKKVSQILDNIKSNSIPSKNLFKSKYRFYDKVFLQVLKDNNEKGEWIFQKYYAKNTLTTIFKFLDEESSFFEDIKVMLSLFSFSFIKAFFKTL